MAIWKLLKDFGEGTSIHGVAFMVESQASLLRKLTWFLLFFAFCVFASLQLKAAIFGKCSNQQLKTNNGSLGQTTHWPRVWCSKYYFFLIISCKILCKNRFNLFSYFFYNFTKIKIKSFECPKSIRNYEKKILLGTSDAWLMSCLSQRPSVLYWRLSYLWTHPTMFYGHASEKTRWIQLNSWLRLKR